MSISCSFFIGDHIECVSGTHNTTGFGPEGKCNNKCPVHLPLSFPGSTSANDCFTPYANILTVSNSVNRITAFSPDSKKHGLLTEGEKVDEPMDIVFISSTEFLVSMWDKNAVVLMNVEGEVIGDFAHVLHPWGLLFLPDLRMVAVAKNSYPYESLIFFSVDDFENGGTLVDTHIASDSVEEVLINIAGASGEPCYLSLGEMDDEVLATTWDGHVVRVCVPTTSCNPAKRNRRMLDGGWSLRGIGVIRQLGVYLVVEYSYERVYSCPIASTDSRLNSDCSTFADQPEGTDWDPYNLQVDEAKHLVYVADRTFSIIHVFSFGGDYFGHLAQNPLFLTLPDALAFKPGPLAAISPITPPSAATAGEPIITPFTLHDRANIPLPTNYNITKDLPRFRITATGLKDGLTTTIHGSVPSASEAHILVKFAGVWTVSITEGIKNPQNLFGSPYEIAVKPAETDPAECEAEFERVFTAGASFSLNITAVDAFRNPTEGMEFEFSCCVGEAMNKAGEYTVEVTPAIKGSPFNFDVKPSDPDAASSTHNIDIGDDTGLVSFKERFLDLRVFPKDRFNNTITDATGYAVSIDGALPTVLAAPEFSHSYTIPADYKGDIEVAFTLNGTNIKGSPVIIKVAPADIIKTEIAAIAFGVLALVSLVLYGRQKKKAARDIRGVAQAGMEKVAKMADQQQALQKMNSVLEESLRKKKHSEDELEVMKKAMTSVSAQRQEELKGVLIPSSGVKIDRLLGKGGFGVVNLATYNGQFVAMKQLLTIDINSVKRFRFECFLMKNLRHPNIVKLVGVCWEDTMFACCLEYVSNGSLDDWLKTTLGTPQDTSPPLSADNVKNVNFTWKDKRLRMVTECALGVQYLHNERYWFDGEYKDGEEVEAPGWRECIIHRDLKPDNMLLTPDWQLKLTDFGEARATDLNNSMTSVGTPIYIAPEIMRADRYDSKADVYSFGICLVAMINAEKNAVEFFFECLRKSMKKKNRRGVGMAILNNRMLNQGWKPNLPATFVQAYPKLAALIRRCWTIETDPRPDFNEIVKLLHGEIADEVRTAMEPNIQQMGEEPDEVYWEEVKRLAECKEVAVEVPEEVSEMEVMKEKYGAMKLKYASVMAELEEIKKAGKKEEEVVEEAPTERKVAKTAQDEELAAMMGMMGK